jgi:hypothetical protein
MDLCGGNHSNDEGIKPTQIIDERSIGHSSILRRISR